jgi:hypothetical protein
MRLFRSAASSWLIVSLVLLTFILRLPLLNGSFWMDEAAQILESSRPWYQQLQIRDDFQPPLLHLWIFFVRHISVTEWWLRFWGALLPALITTWAITKLLAEWWPIQSTAFRQRAGWLGVLLATNSLWIFFSQELRPYSLAVMWCCLSWWAIVRITKTTQPAKRDWIGWVLASLGGLFSTYLFPFVLISQGLFLLWQARKNLPLLKNTLVASIWIAVGFAPWVPSFLGQLAAGQQLRADLPGWDQVVSTTQLKSLPLAAGKFLFGVVDLEPNFWFLGLAALVAGTFGWCGWKIWKLNQQGKLTIDEPTKKALFVFIWWAGVPLILAWLVSFKIPVIQPKRILFALPAFYGIAVVSALMLNEATKTTAKNLQRLLPLFAISLLLAINIWSASEYYRKPEYQRENWRAMHQQISSRYPHEKTLAVFAFGGPFASWTWYNHPSYADLSLGFLTSPTATDVPNALKTAEEKYQFILVFEYLESLTDPRREVKAALHNLGWKEIDAFTQPGVGFVRVYAKPTSLLGLQSAQ